MKDYHIHIDDTITSEVDISGQPVGISAKAIRKQVAQAKASGATRIVLHMNSGGGSVYEGFEIYNILNGSGLEIEAAVESLSASIATLIMLAGGEKNYLSQAPTSQLMFHKPLGKTEGTITDHQSAAENLGQIEDLMAEVYAKKIAQVTGTSYDIQRGYDLMNKGDYFVTPSMAQTLGIIDSIRIPIAAHANFNKINMKNINKKPTALQALLGEISALINPKHITAGSIRLADGNSSIYFEGDELEVGKDVYTDEEMSIHASAGEHIIEDGRTIVVDEAGICIEIKEPILDEQLEAANARIADLEAELETVKNELTAEKQANTTKMNAIDAKMKVLKASIESKDFKAGKEITIRTGTSAKKEDTGYGAKTRGLEEVAARFNKKMRGE